MYICANCNKRFDEPKYTGEDYGWQTELGWHSAYQYFAECPYCESDEIVSAEECVVCGNYFPKDELSLDDTLCYICFECKTELEKEEGKNED